MNIVQLLCIFEERGYICDRVTGKPTSDFCDQKGLFGCFLRKFDEYLNMPANFADRKGAPHLVIHRWDRIG